MGHTVEVGSFSLAAEYQTMKLRLDSRVDGALLEIGIVEVLLD